MSDFDILGGQQRSAKPVNGSQLEYYGKLAADLYRTGEVPDLSKAVVQTVKTAALSPEQVRRVVEFANHDHYIYEHRKLGGVHRIVDFGNNIIADPNTVLQDLNDGGNKPAPVDFSDLDYHKPPMEKSASGLPFDLASIETVKTASDGLGELRSLRVKLADARRHLDYERDQTDRLADVAFGDFCLQVKTAVFNGLTMGDVVAALHGVGASVYGVKTAMARIGKELTGDGSSFRDNLALLESFEKRAAQGIVNPEHPLVTTYQVFEAAAEKLAQLDGARDHLRQREEVIGAFLKHAGKEGLIPKAYDLAGRAAAKAGPVAESATKHLLGEHTPHAKDVRKVVEWGVKKAPTAGLLIGANEVRRRLQNSPIVNSIMAATPGTQAYDQKDMLLAMQGQQGGYY